MKQRRSCSFRDTTAAARRPRPLPNDYFIALIGRGLLPCNFEEPAPASSRSTMAKYFCGFRFTAATHESQQTKIVRLATRTGRGLPMLVSSSPVTGQSFCPPNGSRGAAVAVEGVARVGGSSGGSAAGGGGRTYRRGKVWRDMGVVGANAASSSQSWSKHRRGEHGSDGSHVEQSQLANRSGRISGPYDRPKRGRSSHYASPIA